MQTLEVTGKRPEIYHWIVAGKHWRLMNKSRKSRKLPILLENFLEKPENTGIAGKYSTVPENPE